MGRERPVIERTAVALEPRIRAQAYGLGFDLVGITNLGPVDTVAAFDDWLAHGYAGEMQYMSRWAAERRDSRLPFPGATSAIVVGMNYGGAEPPGPVARYARGDDYHDIMRDRLRELHRWIEEQAGHTVHGRPYVDTGPVLERDLARRAGLGWFGKNTTLINPALGSFFFIGSLFVEMDLTPDAPFEADRCGTCRRCLDRTCSTPPGASRISRSSCAGIFLRSYGSRWGSWCTGATSVRRCVRGTCGSRRSYQRVRRSRRVR